MAHEILIADDDPAILDATKMILEAYGYDVKTTQNGAPLYNMEKDYPDLLLLDIWMSGQDGRDICKYLKNNPETKDIPVILISATKDLAKNARETGAEDCIAKPFEMTELLGRIEKNITKKSS